MAEAIFTFPVDKALKEQFTAAAESGDRPAEQVLRDFMREFVRRQREAIDDDAWFRHQVQVGIDAAMPAMWPRSRKSKPKPLRGARKCVGSWRRPGREASMDEPGASRPEANS